MASRKDEGTGDLSLDDTRSTTRSTTAKLRTEIKTLLAGYRPKDIDAETYRGLAEDWLHALGRFELKTVTAARRQWVEDPERGKFLPTIADMVGVCEQLVAGEAYGKMGAPPEFLGPRHSESFAKATPVQRWCWYARAHAWCEATGFEPRFDVDKRFYDDNLVGQAKAEIQMSEGRAKLLQAIKGSPEAGAGGGSMHRIRRDALTADEWAQIAPQVDRSVADALAAIARAAVPGSGRSAPPSAVVAPELLSSARQRAVEQKPVPPPPAATGDPSADPVPPPGEGGPDIETPDSVDLETFQGGRFAEERS